MEVVVRSIDSLDNYIGINKDCAKCLKESCSGLNANSKWY